MKNNKKFFIAIIVAIIIIVIGCLAYSLNKSNGKVSELEAKVLDNSGENIVIANSAENQSNNIAELNTSNVNEIQNDNKTEKLNKNEMYDKLLNDYKKALNEYDIEDLDSEEKVKTKYDLVNISLITHVARHKSEGVGLTYSFYDIDKNGVEDLIVAADGSAGAIYSYDSANRKPVKIFYQDTIERGKLSIYDNGVIFSEGAGGAALHFYEFGKISKNGTELEVLENIEEEYKDGKNTPEYKDYETRKSLNYKNLDEIKDKYLSNSNPIKTSDADI